MRFDIFNAFSAHAKFEFNILLRSWFFRIFSLIAIIILISFNLTLFATLVPTPWVFKGIASFPPLITTLLLNQGQSALIVFLATDLYKRDLRLDSSKVILIRSMTNISYILGKAFGIVAVFGLLDILILFISAVIQLAIGAVSISLFSYLFYPLVILVPSMIFGIGLSFLLMRYIKNQAVTLLLMLAIMGVSLFFLTNNAGGIFDFLAFYIPLAHSDIAGLSHWDLVLAQRGIYMCLGISFLLWVSFSYQRLIQSFLLNRAVFLTAMVFILAAGFLSFNYIQKFENSRKIRREFKQINSEWNYIFIPSTEKCNIKLTHNGNEIQASAEVTITNNTKSLLDTLIFTLNPDLKIGKILVEGIPVNFIRQLHLILIDMEGPLLPGKSIQVKFEYFGKINEEVIFAEIDDEIREDSYQIFLAKVDKKYAFINNDFVLLPPNSMWYPSSGLPTGSVFPKKNHLDFIDFSLSVSTADGLNAFSQGKKAISDKGYTFKPETPLPFISLIIGKYNESRIKIDSVEYSIATLPDHNYYETHFDQVADTLEYLIRELKQDYERNLNLDYPFKRLTIIETPIQFMAYKRLWSSSSAYVQPEQIWISENGVTIDDADFVRMFRRQDRIASDYTLTDSEMQSNVLKNFFRNTFLGGSDNRSRFRSNNESQPGLNIFPNYYTFLNHFSSQEYLLLNNAIESYLLAKTSTDRNTRPQFETGLTMEEEVCSVLNGKNLSQVLADSSLVYLLSDILRVKGDYLLSQVESYSNTDDFFRTMINFIKENRFKKTDPNLLFEHWNTNSEVEVRTLFEQWINEKEIPRILFKNLELYKVYDGERLRYQIRFKVSNPSVSDALVRVSFSFGGRRQSLLGTDVEEEAPRSIHIKSHSAKEIGIVLDSEPRRLTINAMIAENIPLIFSKRFDKTEINEGALPFDGENDLGESFLFTNHDEIIVDNEDSAFTVLDTVKQNFMQKLFNTIDENSKEKYVRFQFWHPPDYWSKVKNASFFGDYIHSAYYISSGKGNRRVEWSSTIKSAGYYELFVYIVNHQSIERRRFDKDWMRENEYTIFHDDGEDVMTIDVRNSNEGWNYLGSFYFSEGASRVHLSNKTQGRFVIADAVKWVKKQ